MSVKHVLLSAVAALLVVSPTMAVSINIDTNGLDAYYKVNVAGVGDVLAQTTSESRSLNSLSDGDVFTFSMLNGVGFGQFRVQGSVEAGYSLVPLNTQAENNFFPATVGGDGNLTLKLNTVPLTFNVGGFESGWRIPQIVAGADQHTGNKTYVLPMVFTAGFEYGMSPYPSFGRGADGIVYLNSTASPLTIETGTTGFTVAEGSIKTLKWECANLPADLTISFGQAAGGQGGAGLGTLLADAGDAYTFLAGSYYVALSYLNGNSLFQGKVCPILTIPSDFENAAGWTLTERGYEKTILLQPTNDGAALHPVDYYVTFWYPVNVPEPATMSLLALGGLALLRRKRA